MQRNLTINYKIKSVLSVIVAIFKNQQYQTHLSLFLDYMSLNFNDHIINKFDATENLKLITHMFVEGIRKRLCKSQI